MQTITDKDGEEGVDDEKSRKNEVPRYSVTNVSWHRMLVLTSSGEGWLQSASTS